MPLPLLAFAPAIIMAISPSPESALTPLSPGSTGGHKRVVLIRHGRTYMNELLSEPGTRWGDPGFTDRFDDDARFRDSPLSPTGERQARRLAARLEGALGEQTATDADAAVPTSPPSASDGDRAALRDIGLVVCSPLTRACRTAELALRPHLDLGRRIPAVALPLASERLYLVSDVGRPAPALREAFPWIDFGPCGDSPAPWWYVHPDDEEYAEWRPSGEGQTYACRGEPEEHFACRMTALHDWLGARAERTVALVCHWGVIDWLTGEDFDNCELRVVEFDKLRRSGPRKNKDEADQQAEGEA